jgi:hypothetical protein
MCARLVPASAEPFVTGVTPVVEPPTVGVGIADAV